MRDRSTLAALVPTYQRPDALRRCLDGLGAQTRPPDRVLVVAQPDDQATAAVLAGRDVELVPVHEPGQVAALNAGWAAATGDIVAITDDDAVPRPDWLERIEATFATDPAIGAVGGRDVVRHGAELATGEETTVGRMLWYGRFVGFHHLGAGPARDVQFVKGANMAYRRAALAGFDPALRGRGAEHHNDWVASLSVSRSGWRVVYDPAIVVDHFEGSRGDLDPRQPDNRRVAADFAHNQTYAAVRHLPAPTAVVHVLFALLVGTTASPGVAMTAKRIVRGENARASLQLLGQSLAARIAGIATALRNQGGP